MVSSLSAQGASQPRYLALGDSISFGFINQAAFEYVNAANFIGFPTYAGLGVNMNVINAACPVFMAVGTSGVVEPAASFVDHVGGHTRTIYVGAEEPANSSAFTECHLGKAGDVLPDLLAT